MGRVGCEFRALVSLETYPAERERGEAASRLQPVTGIAFLVLRLRKYRPCLCRSGRGGELLVTACTPPPAPVSISFSELLDEAAGRCKGSPHCSRDSGLPPTPSTLALTASWQDFHTVHHTRVVPLPSLVASSRSHPSSALAFVCRLSGLALCSRSLHSNHRRMTGIRECGPCAGNPSQLGRINSCVITRNLSHHLECESL